MTTITDIDKQILDLQKEIIHKKKLSIKRNCSINL